MFNEAMGFKGGSESKTELAWFTALRINVVDVDSQVCLQSVAAIDHDVPCQPPSIHNGLLQLFAQGFWRFPGQTQMDNFQGTHDGSP